MAFMSTLVTYGRGEGVVVGTAMNTEMGKIAKILDEDTHELTPLQKKSSKSSAKCSGISPSGFAS